MKGGGVSCITKRGNDILNLWTIIIKFPNLSAFQWILIKDITFNIMFIIIRFLCICTCDSRIINPLISHDEYILSNCVASILDLSCSCLRNILVIFLPYNRDTSTVFFSLSCTVLSCSLPAQCFPIATETFMNRPIGAFNTVRINIVRSTRNSIDAHDLTWPVYRNLRPWNVRWTVYHLLNWLSRKDFFYHFIAADVFVGCWSCSHLISVHRVSLLED